MTIGTLSLSPEFESDTLNYTTTTTNTSNKITAVALDSTAVIEIKVNNEAVNNGSSYIWASGENTVDITVTDANSTNSSETKYKVIVTKQS